MKKLKKNYMNLKLLIFNLIFIFFLSKSVLGNVVSFEIIGNDNTDTNVILSLLDDIPKNIDEEYTNEIIKILNDSNYFSDVSVKYSNNKYVIVVIEYPNINRLFFDNNERLDDDELEYIANEINFINTNNATINLFIDEVKNVYQSFGYNDVEISYSEKINEETNTVDFYFNINEGKITKINKIIFLGNVSITAQELLDIIQSRTKSIRNIFANNNYKPLLVERDIYTISNYYKNKGFLDINVETEIEYLKSNKVNIYYNITEGDVYSLSKIDIIDEKNILNSSTLDLIKSEKNSFLQEQQIFSFDKIEKLKQEIASLIIDSGVDFFEVNSYEKKEDNSVDIIYQISPISPKYTKQINIVGNNRTFDYVIRRELSIVEGDAIFPNQIDNIRDKLNSLNLFKSIIIKEESIDDNTVNLIIEVEEKQTGTFNAGVSVGTLDGFSIVTGLRENNFYGTGRSLDLLLNTSEDKNQFKLITSDRLSYENDANINYSINYRQLDFSKASSYKLDSFSAGVGIGYPINDNLIHNVDLEYALKDYTVTNLSTVADSIENSSGVNISFLFTNNLRYSTLNRGFIPKSGEYINFNNSVETPTSSNNGFVRNMITLKKFHSNNKNIFSAQARIGNIFSLNNNDILTDDKFSLGGRWLRGFDNYGAGPRNSRTSYVGGNNLAVTKFDYSYEVSRNSNFPIYVNIFNDYGLLWDNKTTPTHNDNTLRSSAGFGIKYYSPIGPIGFTWGFPLVDEEYDIKRMFLFSIGNID